MRRYPLIPLIAAIGMISLLGGYHTTSGTRAGDHRPAFQSDASARPQETENPSASLTDRAYAKPCLNERMDRKYGTPRPLPDVPAAMEHLRPLCATGRIERRVGHRTYRSTVVFTRSADHAHVAFKEQDQEWLFVRNAVDGRRVFGLLTDHHQRAVLEYPQSDLLDAGVADGWAEVMTLGLPLDLIGNMVATGKSRSLDGIVFNQYLPKDSRRTDAGTPAEIWWSRQYDLPLKIVRNTKDGQWIQELTHIRFNIDPELFKAPLERFAQYAVSDNADWSGCDHNHAAIHVTGLAR